DRHRPARPHHQHRLPRDRASRAVVASVGARRRRIMTLYTGTLRTPAPKKKIWSKVGENTLYAVGLPLVLLVIWGVAATIAPAKFFPGPQTIAVAFVDTWIGPAFLQDVLPSLARLTAAIVVAVVIGIVMGTLIGLTRWLRELL